MEMMQGAVRRAGLLAQALLTKGWNIGGRFLGGSAYSSGWKFSMNFKMKDYTMVDISTRISHSFVFLD